MKLKQPATPKQSVVVAKPVAVNPTAAKPVVAKLVAPARTQAPAKVQHRATVNLNNALPPGEYWANAGSTTYSMPKQKTKKSKHSSKRPPLSSIF